MTIEKGLEDYLKDTPDELNENADTDMAEFLLQKEKPNSEKDNPINTFIDEALTDGRKLTDEQVKKFQELSKRMMNRVDDIAMDIQKKKAYFEGFTKNDGWVRNQFGMLGSIFNDLEKIGKELSGIKSEFKKIK